MILSRLTWRRKLQDTFKEIMVDEYQDTNGVQETIINLISRVDNRFYVGDVKQAIYSFRMADSSLFMEKYNTYGDTDAIERRIDLAKNFRSHEKYFWPPPTSCSIKS